MEVYRVAKSQYIRDLSGFGAQVKGGRWNLRGTRIVHTSENRSLAILEYRVHLPNESVFPNNLSIATIKIPDDIVPKKISTSDLPNNWRISPPLIHLAKLVTKLINSNNYLLIQVPSAVVPWESNIIINPSHPDMSLVAISRVERYRLDVRLIPIKKGVKK